MASSISRVFLAFTLAAVGGCGGPPTTSGIDCDRGFAPASNAADICCPLGFPIADAQFCYQTRDDVPGPSGLSPNQERALTAAATQVEAGCLEAGFTLDELDAFAVGISADWLSGISMANEIQGFRNLCNGACLDVSCFLDCTSCTDGLGTVVYLALDTVATN